MDKHGLIKQSAESDLLTFIKLVAPHRVLGDIHRDMCEWWTSPKASSHQLVLLPRDHQKSAMIAYRVAWHITRNPETTILYVSATANLAEKQLKFIKDILTSDVYRRYWPEMVNVDEGKRERWTNTEISVDHPKRKLEGVRDPTVFTAGLTTSITGMHCNVAVLDDVVVIENAYTQDGREKVKTLYSLLASIETTDAQEWVVGTRYHPSDLYGELMDMEDQMLDADGNILESRKVYEVYKREVEDRGDGAGVYLWPRQKRKDGKWFGFNQSILAKKKAQYLDKTQFYAQYYNNPNASEEEAISKEYFQYYDPRHLVMRDGRWHFKDQVLLTYAAIDFAFSLKQSADYTAIAVVGVDADRTVYVLDLARFKTNKIADYYKSLIEMYNKWGFRKMRAEVSVAQEAVVQELKDQYIRREGIPLSVESHRPVRSMGTKEERLEAILKPRYENRSIWHFTGGLVNALELELRQVHPRNDDLKDALANAVEIALPPIKRKTNSLLNNTNVTFHPRFGGVA